MSNELIPVSGMQKYDDKAFELANKSANTYLDRLQFMTSNSEKCKSGEFPINNFARVASQVYKDLGKEVDAIILAWRPKAVELGDSPVTSYDPESEVYLDIAERSNDQNSGCMYGTEFLLWLPNENVFVTFYATGKTGRKEASHIRQFVGHGVTFIGKKCENSKYTWYTASVRECNSITNIPTADQYSPIVDKFNNPPENEVEVAPEGTRER